MIRTATTTLLAFQAPRRPRTPPHLDDVGRPELSDPRNAELARRPGLQTHHEQSRATGRRAKRPRGRGDQARGENAALSLSVEIRPDDCDGDARKRRPLRFLARKPSISLNDRFLRSTGADGADPMATTRSSESRLACPAPACLLARGEAADSAERHQRVAHRFDQRDARREWRGDMLHVLAVERSRSVRAEPSGWSTRSPVLTRVGFCVRRRSPSGVLSQAGSPAIGLARFCGELSSASRT